MNRAALIDAVVSISRFSTLCRGARDPDVLGVLAADPEILDTPLTPEIAS